MVPAPVSSPRAALPVEWAACIVARRIDRGLSARLDLLNMVQETLGGVASNLSDDAGERPLPFDPPLDRRTVGRPVAEHRRHLRPRARGVGREERPGNTRAAHRFVDRRIAADLTPAAAALRGEQRAPIQRTEPDLPETGRGVLLLSNPAQVVDREIAVVVGIGLGTGERQHRHAPRRIRVAMGADEAAR